MSLAPVAVLAAGVSAVASLVVVLALCAKRASAGGMGARPLSTYKEPIVCIEDDEEEEEENKIARTISLIPDETEEEEIERCNSVQPMRLSNTRSIANIDVVEHERNHLKGKHSPILPPKQYNTLRLSDYSPGETSTERKDEQELATTNKAGQFTSSPTDLALTSEQPFNRPIDEIYAHIAPKERRPVSMPPQVDSTLTPPALPDRRYSAGMVMSQLQIEQAQSITPSPKKATRTSIDSNEHDFESLAAEALKHRHEEGYHHEDDDDDDDDEDIDFTSLRANLDKALGKSSTTDDIALNLSSQIVQDLRGGSHTEHNTSIGLRTQSYYDAVVPENSFNGCAESETEV